MIDGNVSLPAESWSSSSSSTWSMTCLENKMLYVAVVATPKPNPTKKDVLDMVLMMLDMVVVLTMDYTMHYI